MSDGKDVISMFSVRTRAATHGYIFAIVPDEPDAAYERLKSDDPIWRRNEVTLHWVHRLSSSCGLKVSNRMKIFARGLKAKKAAQQLKAAIA